VESTSESRRRSRSRSFRVWDNAARHVAAYDDRAFGGSGAFFDLTDEVGYDTFAACNEPRPLARCLCGNTSSQWGRRGAPALGGR
jgi:hypothetical protein